MSVRLTLLAVVAAVIAAAVLPGEAQQRGRTRPLTTSQLMAGLIKPQLTALKEGLEAGPDDKDAWKAAATSAALLNESSYLMMDDGRCPDQTWSDACIQLKDATLEILEQIDAGNRDAAVAGVDGVIASCKHCHEEFKYNRQQ